MVTNLLLSEHKQKLTVFGHLQHNQLWQWMEQGCCKQMTGVWTHIMESFTAHGTPPHPQRTKRQEKQATKASNQIKSCISNQTPTIQSCPLQWKPPSEEILPGTR